MDYKRNQIEEAISRVLERSPEPGSELRTRLKRLLDTDRTHGRNKRSAKLAFFSGNPPGRGIEIWFSDYEAFALLTGLMLMNHGWPQGFAVEVLRRVRAELETHHARVLQQDPTILFDEAAIVQAAKPGHLAVSNSDPVFLAIGSAGAGDVSMSVCRGQEELMRVMHERRGAWTIFELVTLIHQLHSDLAETKPAKRGPPST